MTQQIDYSPWGKFRRRLEQAAQQRLQNNSTGHVVVSVCILMDARGNPVQWTEPRVTKVEPANRCEVLSILAGDSA